MQDKVKDILKTVRKQAGTTEVLYVVGDPEHDTKIERVSTGIFELDAAIGGGLPRGRIVEFFGPESGGKTTLSLVAISSAQKAGLICAFIDAEHALDVDWAAKIGVDTENLLISQPGSGEEANTTIEQLLEAGVDLIVVDSVSALVPRAELDGEYGDAQIALQARLMSQSLRKMNGIISNKRAILLYINQIREMINVMYGPKETTTGGRALKFYSSIRIDVRRKDWVKQGNDIIGAVTKAKIVKNKTFPPFRECEYQLMFASGVDDRLSWLERLAEAGLINKSGAWWSYAGKKAQGWQPFLELIGTDVFESLKQAFGDDETEQGEQNAEDVEGNPFTAQG